MNSTLKHLILPAFIATTAVPMSAERFEVTSPSGNIVTAVSTDADGALSYEVSRGGVSIITPSPLGLKIGAASYDSFPQSVTATMGVSTGEFPLLHGKASLASDCYNEMTLDCVGSGSRALRVIFRVYDNAVAFRYEVNNRSGLRLTSEMTAFNFSTIESTWAMPYRKDYSWYYDRRTFDELTDSEGYGFPMLVKTASGYALLTEADNEATMSASRLEKGSQNCQFTLAHFAASSIIGDKFLTPWRTIILGELSDIVESTVVQSLVPRTEMTDTGWIKPGKMSWNWGAEDADNQPTIEQAKAYIDLAAYYGWEYFLLDDGWENRLDPAEVAAYANEKGIGLFLWAHQARFSSDVNTNLQWFRQWADAGVKGVKIDFFEDDSRDMLAKYEGILEAAAQAHLMVNFHGCIKPSGLERKWPHLMTSEAVLGGEFYMFNTTMTPASHGVNLCLTRNVLGSMDYTPVKYGNKNGRVITNTTWSYQTALTVAFESSLLCLCDCPANLIGNIAEPMLRNVPVSWDEVKCLEASPSDNITIARRKGDDWWLATLTSEPRKLTVDFSFLPENETYGAYIYSEGIQRSDIAFEYRENITRNSAIDLELGANSGATVILSKNSDMVAPIVMRREAEDYNYRGIRKSDADCSGGKYIDELFSEKKYLDFNDIEVAGECDAYITLFYMATEEKSGYIQVNGGEKEYHMFRRTGSSVNGRDVYFKTVKVHLLPGVNSIRFGNDNATAPAIDRVTVTAFGAPQASGVDEVSADPLNVSAFVLNGGVLSGILPFDSMAYVFDTAGHLLSSGSHKAGQVEISIPSGQPVIVNIVSGSYSTSMKVYSNR